jgi:ABC-2 type transport system permease protein
LVTLSPAFLLFLLAYVFSFDVGQLKLAVLDLDRSALSRRYLARITSDQDLHLAYEVASYEEATPLLVSGEVDAVVVIPPDFADTVYRSEPVQVQAIIDGTDPFAGSQASGALEARSSAFVAAIAAEGSRDVGEPFGVQTIAWYNAGLKSLLSMVPGLMAIVLIMPTMALALALTREKETGTLEGLIVTPVSGLEYLTGKLLAYVTTGLLSTLLALVVAVFWFEVPLQGSVWLYLLLTSVYFLACMGITVIVANFVRNQQTAMFIVMLAFLVPSFFLAGLITPVNTDSLGSLLTSYVLPTTHFVEISRAVLLKGLGARDLARPILVLLGMGMGGIAIGLALFRKKVR